LFFSTNTIFVLYAHFLFLSSFWAGLFVKIDDRRFLWMGYKSCRIAGLLLFFGYIKIKVNREAAPTKDLVRG